MRMLRLILVAALSLIAYQAGAVEKPRPWTTRNGDILVATAFTVHDGTLFLLPRNATDGRLKSVKIDELAFEDQDYLDRRRDEVPTVKPYRDPIDTTLRTWTSNSGSTVEARLLSVDGPTLMLEKSGAVYEVSVVSLSQPDRDYVQGRLEAVGGATGTVDFINPTRPWQLKDGRILNTTLRGYRPPDQSLKFRIANRDEYIAFYDLIPEDQVVAYRYLQQHGTDVSELTPEGDMSAEVVDLTTFLPTAEPIPEKSTWTSADGRSANAEFVALNGYFVILQRGGNELLLKINKLAIPDQEFLRRYHGYYGPIGNDRPAPGDAMEIDLAGSNAPDAESDAPEWGVTPGEFVDIRKMDGKLLKATFPETRVPEVDDASLAGDAFTAPMLDESDEAFSDDDDDGARASLTGPSDTETPELTQEELDEMSGMLGSLAKKGLPIMGLLGVQTLLYLVAGILAIVTGLKAKDSGGMFFMGSIASGVMGLCLVAVSFCLGVFNVIAMPMVVALPAMWAKQAEKKRLFIIFVALCGLVFLVQVAIFLLKKSLQADLGI